jgi:hypothetical protein
VLGCPEQKKVLFKIEEVPVTSMCILLRIHLFFCGLCDDDAPIDFKCSITLRMPIWIFLLYPDLARVGPMKRYFDKDNSRFNGEHSQVLFSGWMQECRVAKSADLLKHFSPGLLFTPVMQTVRLK